MSEITTLLGQARAGDDGALAAAFEALYPELRRIDLKPANILVSSDGEVHLLDFSIAKPIDGDAAQATALTDRASNDRMQVYPQMAQLRASADLAQSAQYADWRLSMRGCSPIRPNWPVRSRPPGSRPTGSGG